jgi:hypothetical protein
MRKIGKVGKKLIALSKEFHEEHPGAQLCHYCLYMGWENWLEVWNAEHTLSKVRHPGFRFDKGKLVISCAWHNADKSSKDIEEYLAILDERKLAASKGQVRSM